MSSYVRKLKRWWKQVNCTHRDPEIANVSGGLQVRGCLKCGAITARPAPARPVARKKAVHD